MLFNTPEFIFLFLPAAVVLHFALARWSVDAAVIGTTFSSLVFYAWWNPPFVVLPAASIALNFWLAARMVAAEPLAARALLIAGIVGNLLVLGYFKYADFLLSDRKSTRLNSSHVKISYAVFCLKKKKN